MENIRKWLFGIIAIGIPVLLIGQSAFQRNPFTTNQIPAGATGNTVVWGSSGPTWQTGPTNQAYTNYLVYGSNYYAGDTYASNFFLTSVLTNVAVSNYFANIVYLTNAGSPVTIETYMAGDPGVSNAAIALININQGVSNYVHTNTFIAVTNSYTNVIGGEYIGNNSGAGTNITIYGYLRLPGYAGNSLLMLSSLGYFVSVAAPASGGVLTNNGAGLIYWVPIQELVQHLNIKTLNVTSNVIFQSNVLIMGFATLSNLTPNMLVGTDASNNLVSTNVTGWSIMDTNQGVMVLTNANRQLWLAATNVRTDQLTGTLTNEVAPVRFLTATNTFQGPTNLIDCARGNDQYYTTYTPCNFTNIANINFTNGNSIQVSIYNDATTNIDVLPPPTTIQANGAAGAITVSNKTERIFWFKIRNGRTNLITQSF